MNPGLVSDMRGGRELAPRFPAAAWLNTASGER